MNWPVPQIIERCARAIVGEGGRRLGRVEVYRETSARRHFQSRMVQTEKLVSLGQRASSIVHELSNPLTTILGYAQRLLQREEGRPEPASRELRGLLAEAERATGILRQMLQLSGDARSVREPMSLNELVDRTSGLMRASLSGSAIHLMVEKGASVPDVEGDFGQLQQMLLNLLQNAQQAITHSGQGGLIGVRTGSAGAGRARLEVWDDGPGDSGRDPGAHFRSVFYHQATGCGHGPRSCDRSGIRAATRRNRERSQSTEGRHTICGGAARGAETGEETRRSLHGSPSAASRGGRQRHRCGTPRPARTGG